MFSVEKFGNHENFMRQNMGMSSHSALRKGWVRIVANAGGAIMVETTDLSNAQTHAEPLIALFGAHKRNKAHGIFILDLIRERSQVISEVNDLRAILVPQLAPEPSPEPVPVGQ